ncbi:hypothetical protein EA187_06785 [Lujinxingia sediminis]|uniref:SRCR domain-containing protein n=1 Tax=Lujinxingia sediminis TaxID=2480984 RepID=A0ABY0CUU3_9DELT|nr:hypothetical protein [Lujinxingia sediminis]RVU46833.1 hypothetical protein EA187_06785 [Lujinxingia sediminis]
MTSKRSRWLSSWLVVVLISLGLLSCSDSDGEVIVADPDDGLDVGDLLDAPLPDVGDVPPAPTCDDGEQNGGETGVDCGGSECEACEPGQGCEDGGDCSSGLCQNNICVGVGCEGVSCDEGQACYRGQCYAACDHSAECGAEERCFQGACTALSCDDVICGAAETCYRGVCYATCQDDGSCSEEGAQCVEGGCVVPTCDDGVQNGAESDVDCGGDSCEACDVGQQCGADADCGEALAGPWGECVFEDGDACIQAGVQTRVVEVFSCGEEGVCASEEIEGSQSCERVTEADVCAEAMFGEWSSCEALEGAEADLCAYDGERRRTVTSFACASQSCEPAERDEVESCVRETDALACGEAVIGEWSGCEAVDGASVCALEGERRREIATYSCAEGGCQESISEEVESCALETDALECGAQEVGEWGPCMGFDGTCSQTGTQTRTITSYACGSGACVPSQRDETQSCSRDQGGVQCQEPDYGAWSDCGGFANACALEGTRSRTVTYYECAGDDSCAPREEVETESCTRDTTGMSCGAGVTHGEWSSCEYATECSLNGERTRSVVTQSCAGGGCESVTTTEIDTTACVRNTAGTSCGEGVTYGDWSASCEYASVCALEGTRTRSVVTRSCAGGSCEAVTTSETEVHADCARDTADVECGGTTHSDWSACGGFADECAQEGTQTRTATDRICAGGDCSSVDRTESQSCTRDTTGMSCGAGVTHGEWSSCEYATECSLNGERTRSVVTRSCVGGSCESVTTTEIDTTACVRNTAGTSCGEGVTYGDWSASCEYASVCALEGTRTRSVTTQSCADGSCSSVTSSQTATRSDCDRITTGDSCGAGVTYGDWSSTCSYANACSETGTRTRSVTTRTCSGGDCGAVTTSQTSTRSDCARDRSGVSCGSSTHTSWSACGGFANTCDTTGTQTRTRTDYNCSGGSCTTSTATETQACTRVTQGNSCGGNDYTSWSNCGGFSNTCDESGTQTRTRTEYHCSGGSCASSNFTESRTCYRDTDSSSCGTTSTGSWGSCGGFSSPCDRTGEQSRTVSERKCSNGTCTTVNRTETQSCTRSVTGNSCGASTHTSWGSCGGFSSTCDTTGEQTRTRTDYICNSSGTCTTSTATETQACTRSTHGTSCGTTQTGNWSSCGGFTSSCDETGTRTRSVTTYTCSNNSCTSSTTTETDNCSRNTDGISCGSGSSCGNWSFCQTGFGQCTGTQTRSCTDYRCSNGSCSSTTRTESQSCHAFIGRSCTANNGWSGCCDGNGYCEPQSRPGEPIRVCEL